MANAFAITDDGEIFFFSSSTRDVLICGYALVFTCYFRFFFSSSRIHAQVSVLVKIIHRHYSAITLVHAARWRIQLVRFCFFTAVNTETIAS